MATSSNNPDKGTRKTAAASPPSEQGQGRGTDDLPLCQKLQRPFGEAFAKFLTELQQARTGLGHSAWDIQLDFQKQARDAHDSLLRAPAEEKASTWKSAQGLPQQYAEALQTTHKQAVQRAADAYRSYLRDVQTAWAGTDVNLLDAGSLAAISHSIQLAACYAQALRAVGQ